MRPSFVCARSDATGFASSSAEGKKMRPPSRTIRAIARAAAAFAAAAGSSTTDGATIYAGPAYNATTLTGFQNPEISIGPGGGTVADGRAVGHASKYVSGVDKGTRALRWDTSGAAATELGHLGTNSAGYTTVEAYAINPSGLIVGSAGRYESGLERGTAAVRWDPAGTAATELGNLGTSTVGRTISSAFAVNAAGTVVGTATRYDPVSHLSRGARAVRWDAASTTAVELQHLGTSSLGNTGSVAYAINSTGTIVGHAGKYDSSGAGVGSRAVRWDPSGTVTELGHIGTDATGKTTSNAYAVNAGGTAVGFANRYDPVGKLVGTRAVRWDGSDTAATELQNLGTDATGDASG
jgi:hypothetical protein